MFLAFKGNVGIFKTKRMPAPYDSGGCDILRV